MLRPLPFLRAASSDSFWNINCFYLLLLLRTLKVTHISHRRGSLTSEDVSEVPYTIINRQSALCVYTNELLGPRALLDKVTYVLHTS